MLFQQNRDRSEQNKGEERSGQLVIPSGDTAKMLKFVEEAFYKMPFFVQPPITFALIDTV